MNSLLRLGYTAAGQLARALAAIAPVGAAPADSGGKAAQKPPGSAPGASKAMRSLRARRGIRARFRRFGAEGRDPQRPLLWVHAPSVGEALQALPVIRLLRERREDIQIVFTHFSPSAERFVASLGADFHDYLPFDTAGDADAALESLRPDAIVFSKLDVWPILTEKASSRGVPLGLISATMAQGSGRRGFISRALLHDAYGRLDRVGAIDAGDAELLAGMGVRRQAITVTGDTRYDQVAQRAAAADLNGALLSPLASGRPTLVAGSTWPSDEKHLLPAFRGVARASAARLIIAPHELTEVHLAWLERWSSEEGFSSARLGAPGAGDADVLIVDRMGVLGELYALADVAYVGGAFHRAGLHSVLEPAAFGAPVLFGPRHHGSRDAALLIERRGGIAVGNGAELERALARWLMAGSTERKAAGAEARKLVESGEGAAERSTALVLQLLGAGSDLTRSQHLDAGDR